MCQGEGLGWLREDGIGCERSRDEVGKKKGGEDEDERDGGDESEKGRHCLCR